MTSVDLSIIIPVYNAMPLLARTLNSIFSQKTKYTYEVILVDDGGKDNSVEYIESLQETNIILLQQQNAGPALARNNGMERATGRYCAYLDADDFWENTFIEKTVSFLEKHKDCVAVSVGQKHMTVSGDGISPKCIDNYKQPFVLDDFFSFWGKWMHVCTGSVCIRTEVMKQAEGQRTDLRVTEDLEFWALLSTYGKWGIIPEVLFVSDGTEQVKTNEDWMLKMMPRWKNAPSIEDWQKRLVPRIDEASEGFKQARGKIASILVYGHIMSSRPDLGRKTVKNYGDYFPMGNVSKIMKMAAATPISWWLLCKIIHRKEDKRFKQ